MVDKKRLEKGLSKVNKHLHKLWCLSKDFYLKGDYPTASFFAITLIEETGKAVLIYREEFNERDFYNHKRKYEISIAFTLFVNSRVASIYKNLEKKFAKWYRTGELFEIRNNSLYISNNNNITYSPEEKIDQETAFILVCISGEVFAEIQGDFVGAHPLFVLA